MSEQELYDDFMNRYSMPSLTAMGGKETGLTTITEQTTVIRHRTRSGHTQDMNPWIGWTHNFDNIHSHRPRSYSGSSPTAHSKPSSMDDLDRPKGGFFQRIRDTFHL